MPRIYQVMISHPPKLTDNKTILLNLDSSLQKTNFIEKALTKLAKHLKTNLCNYSIEINIEVADAKEKSNLIYSATDKFNFLANLNEELNNLKSIFNLNLE